VLRRTMLVGQQDGHQACINLQLFSKFLFWILATCYSTITERSNVRFLPTKNRFCWSWGLYREKTERRSGL